MSRLVRSLYSAHTTATCQAVQYHLLLPETVQQAVQHWLFLVQAVKQAVQHRELLPQAVQFC